MSLKQVDEEGTPKEEAVKETDKIFAEDMIDQELAPDGFDSVDGNDAICTGSQSQPHPLSHIQSLSHSQPQLHTKARKSPYPASGVARFPVPDCFVHWEVDFPEYNPPDYTSVMLKLSTSIDKDDTSDINFNTLDNGVDRKSFFGLYEVNDERPRWKRGLKGEIFTRGKSSLEFLGLKKNDVVIFPGEINKASAKVPEIVLKALATRKKQNVDQQPWEMFSDTAEISIYFDDTRNTDNAWLETKVINYHFDFEMDTDFKLENSNLFWIELDSEVSVTAEHNECLAKVAEKRGAHF
ncbi:ADP-ribose pyrophosphatase, mitochondrial-like [Rhopilema esculentum]|uniref:ADP-ribose pyrophosphatase, mitochondrial-like n=1 Tax=Rhopilema esculentum TaxID=499914 RepID=UPI0031D3008D